jgi:hypothetical protein
MRAVTSATAAAVIGIERKAFDNMLSRIEGPELPRGRQGLERRIPVSLLPQLLLSAELSARLGVSLKDSFQLARDLLDGRDPGGPFVSIRADVPRLRAEIDRQLESAIETVVRPRRGRPRRSAGN